MIAPLPTDGRAPEPVPSPGEPATGTQWVIGHGSQEVVVTEVGATLRSYRVGEHEVIDGFGPEQWSHSGRGQVLAPWPNRLGDGRYEFGGRSAKAALDEPERGNAIHGLVRWLPWRLEAHAQNVVAVACRVYPTPGYPFRLDLRIEYRLGRDGLTITTTAGNPGDATLPFGLGFHPYLTVGSERIDTVSLALPASRRLVLDSRALPTGEVQPVAGTEYDFSAGRVIGPTRLDTAFTGLARPDGGVATATLRAPGAGRSVSLWADENFKYLMCYTGDTLDDEAERRTSVAIEPMTCPPDALRSGRDLIVLAPGQEWTGRWGITPGV
ncbi:MAG: aldose 1-epimerase family protein [Actinomycetota bacterium]|nr:aldose 1-epimerase family protein [Actinomycetota bacterium]